MSNKENQPRTLPEEKKQDNKNCDNGDRSKGYSEQDLLDQQRATWEGMPE